MKTILVDAVNTFVIAGAGIYRPLHELLESYPNRKILLTGANDMQMVEYGLTNLPYELFTRKHNPEKSDPTYYRFVLDTYRLKPTDTVYIEHNLEAVKSAQSLGIITHWYDPGKKDLVALKDFLDKNL